MQSEVTPQGFHFSFFAPFKFNGLQVKKWLFSKTSGLVRKAMVKELGVSNRQFANVLRPKEVRTQSHNTRQFDWIPIALEIAVAKICKYFDDEFADIVVLEINKPLREQGPSHIANYLDGVNYGTKRAY